MTDEMDNVNSEDRKQINPMKKLYHDIPRGKPKSGRTWKTVRTERHSSFKRVKRFKTSWDEKMSLKDERRKIKELQEHIKGEKIKEKQLRRLRSEEKKKQKLLNQRKSEITQPIKSTKLKKLKKKQLRVIETR